MYWLIFTMLYYQTLFTVWSNSPELLHTVNFFIVFFSGGFFFFYFWFLFFWRRIDCNPHRKLEKDRKSVVHNHPPS